MFFFISSHQLSCGQDRNADRIRANLWPQGPLPEVWTVCLPNCDKSRRGFANTTLQKTTESDNNVLQNTFVSPRAATNAVRCTDALCIELRYDMVYFRIKHGYFLHRKLYVLTGWVPLFFFLCHNDKRIPVALSFQHYPKPSLVLHIFFKFHFQNYNLFQIKTYIMIPFTSRVSSIFQSHYDMIWWWWWLGDLIDSWAGIMITYKKDN